MTRYRMFDRARIQLEDIARRGHDLVVDECLALQPPNVPLQNADFADLVNRIVRARQAGRPVVLMMGGHPVKLGLSRFLIDLIERGWISHVAMNGAGLIHDFELAMVGGTSESVQKWIKVGQFGLWKQTSLLNDAIRDAAERDEGLGEGVGRFIEEHEFPHGQLSIARAGWRHRVPVTCHVSIGSDIIHPMANCDGASLGATSYKDFLIVAHAIENLENGVFLNVGTAVTGPEVYLKALSMARNVARQQGTAIRHFTTAVFDLVELPSNWRDGSPAKDHPGYYFRPWKTILLRTVSDGGQSYYFCCDHTRSVPSLWHALVQCGDPLPSTTHS